MIKSIKFKQDFRSFKKGDEFTFKPGVNILVGDQGSGKSTLIEMIRIKFNTEPFSERDSSWRAKKIDIKDIDKCAEFDNDAATNILGFDFERESARDMSMIHDDMISIQLYAMKASHGQGNMTSVADLMQKAVKGKKP